MISSEKEAQKLIHSGFDEKVWFEVHDYNSKNNSWALDKTTLFEKDKVTFDDLYWYEQMVEEHYPMTGGRVLEIGGHVGRFSLYKALQSVNLKIYVIDASENFTKLSTEHLNRIKVHNIYRTTQLAENMNFDDETFGRVYALETMEHYGDLDKALSEIVRVLKPAGDYVFSIPFENNSDGGFHTQKHTKEYWYQKLSEYFDDVEMIYTENGGSCIGRCIK